MAHYMSQACMNRLNRIRDDIAFLAEHITRPTAQSEWFVEKLEITSKCIAEQLAMAEADDMPTVKNGSFAMDFYNMPIGKRVFIHGKPKQVYNVKYYMQKRHGYKLAIAREADGFVISRLA